MSKLSHFSKFCNSRLIAVRVPVVDNTFPFSLDDFDVADIAGICVSSLSWDLSGLQVFDGSPLLEENGDEDGPEEKSHEDDEAVPVEVGHPWGRLLIRLFGWLFCKITNTQVRKVIETRNLLKFWFLMSKTLKSVYYNLIRPKFLKHGFLKCDLRVWNVCAYKLHFTEFSNHFLGIRCSLAMNWDSLPKNILNLYKWFRNFNFTFWVPQLFSGVRESHWLRQYFHYQSRMFWIPRNKAIVLL